MYEVLSEGGGVYHFKYFTKGGSIFLRASKRGYYTISLYDKECPIPPYGINNERSLVEFATPSEPALISCVGAASYPGTRGKPAGESARGMLGEKVWETSR